MWVVGVASACAVVVYEPSLCTISLCSLVYSRLILVNVVSYYQPMFVVYIVGCSYVYVG